MGLSDDAMCRKYGKEELSYHAVFQCPALARHGNRDLQLISGLIA
jgi:hypothetical protein